MVLVGPDDSAKVVALRLRLEHREVRPEAGDLQEHLRTLGVQVLGVAGGLAVLPHVVRDRRADVVLEPGVVRQPAPRAGVEMPLLGLLAAIAAALPGVHRPGPAVRGGGFTGSREASVAVVQQSSGDLREVQVEVGQDEQLVPEDMADRKSVV